MFRDVDGQPEFPAQIRKNGFHAFGVALHHIITHKAELPEIAPQYAAYEGLLRGLLAKAPGDRFQSARALLTAISAVKVPA